MKHNKMVHLKKYRKKKNQKILKKKVIETLKNIERKYPLPVIFLIILILLLII